MAQRKRNIARNLRLLARRYGMDERKAAIGVIGFVLLMCAVGIVRMSARTDFFVQRGSGEVATATSGTDVDTDKSADKSASASGEASGEGGSSARVRVIVHVDGAVVAPGVYELTGEDLRINDAVARAGGLRADADTSTMNLAAPVEDGQKVHVPLVGEQQVATEVASTTSAPSTGQTTAEASAADAGGLVNINSASAQELTSLTGVGEATAQDIVADREQNGPFETIEDLMRVPGIAEKKFSKLKGQICV